MKWPFALGLNQTIGKTYILYIIVTWPFAILARNILNRFFHSYFVLLCLVFNVTLFRNSSDSPDIIRGSGGGYTSSRSFYTNSSPSLVSGHPFTPNTVAPPSYDMRLNPAPENTRWEVVTTTERKRERERESEREREREIERDFYFFESASGRFEPATPA